MACAGLFAVQQAVSILIQVLELAPRVELVQRPGAQTRRQRRIGVSMHFVPPTTKQVVGSWDCAALVRGEDRYWHFEHTPVPARDFDPTAVRVQATASRLVGPAGFEPATNGLRVRCSTS